MSLKIRRKFRVVIQDCESSGQIEALQIDEIIQKECVY